MLFLVVIEMILSIPTALFASIVNVKNNRYCEIDLSSSTFLSDINRKNEDVSGDDSSNSGYFYSANLHQIILCLYYLIYSSILTFWLPLVVSYFIGKYKSHMYHTSYFIRENDCNVCKYILNCSKETI